MKKNFISVVAIGFGLVALLLAILSYSAKKDIVWFDYNKVYNECDLKVSLEKDLEKVVSARSSELDSLQLELTFMSNKVETGNASETELADFEDLKGRYLTLQTRYEQENIRLKEEYFTQIRKSINDKSKTYAEDNGYDFMFAAVGDGSLMYATEGDDVTKEFLEYVNR